MPNTIAHIGIHAFVTRSIFPWADLKWIFLGAILSDLPFVLKRGITFLGLDVDILDVRLMSVVQASLLFSLVLALVIAQFSNRVVRVFGVLALGVIMHLLLDACQIKWGNGPRLLLPADWSILNFGLFWPEQLPSHLLTLIGAIILVLAFMRPLAGQASDLRLPPLRRWGLVFAGALVYLLGPLLLLDLAERSGAGSVQIIRQAERSGLSVELDRARFRTHSNGVDVELYSGRFITLDGIVDELPKSGKISIKGEFTSHNVINATEYHLNHGQFRELASVLGLGVVLAYWLAILGTRISGRRRRIDNDQSHADSRRSG